MTVWEKVLLHYKHRRWMLCLKSQNKLSIRKCCRASLSQFAFFVCVFLFVFVFFPLLWSKSNRNKNAQVHEITGNSERKKINNFMQQSQTCPGIWILSWRNRFSILTRKMLFRAITSSLHCLTATCAGSRSIWSASGSKPLPSWLGAHITMCNERKIKSKSQLAWDHAAACICS